ncbi:MAG: SIS domain-containing protein [Candidatus Promineifilaceae bacterium]
MNTPILRRYIESLPSLTTSIAKQQWKASQEIFTTSFMPHIERIYLTGCGDSYHASVGSVLAFEQMTGIPSFAQTAMQLSRFSSPFFSDASKGSILVLAISASGEVSRTIEALDLAKKAGATTIAITANEKSTLAVIADFVLSTAISPLPDEPQDIIVPGSRSYMVSLVSLYSVAIAAGMAWNHHTGPDATILAQELSNSGELIQWTIENSSKTAKVAAERWIDDDGFVFCGAGPNYGTAMFSAAKLLEASGDQAIGQDLEEWAHLQFFARRANTPTVIISGGIWDQDRAMEVADAARTIGRQLAVVAPSDSPLVDLASDDDCVFQVAPIRDSISPLVTGIPGMLFASERASHIGEPYFRDFAGGRSREGGGGISRIRTSNRIAKHLE